MKYTRHRVVTNSLEYDQFAHEICVEILKMEMVMDKVMDRVVET